MDLLCLVSRLEQAHIKKSWIPAGVAINAEVIISYIQTLWDPTERQTNLQEGHWHLETSEEDQKVY